LNTLIRSRRPGAFSACRLLDLFGRIGPPVDGDPHLGVDQHRLVGDVDGGEGVLDHDLEVQVA